MSPAIIFENVSKRYDLRAGQGTLRDAIPALTARLFRRNSNPSSEGSRSSNEIWALRDVSFEVQPGEALGIIGANGAGKTTALSLLAGITRPTAGRIAVAGRVGALIQLGAGFHPDLSGRENVYLNASILGLKKAEVDRIYDDIVAFAELDAFMDTPVKRYSSGMYARLGFAVAAHVDPDVLLVDEVLAVGDMNFQSKCMRRMREVMASGKVVIFVSHTLAAVQTLCTRAIWLDYGQIRAEGEPGDVVASYTNEMNRRASMPDSRGLASGTRMGSGEVRITNVEVLNGHGQPTDTFHMGDSLTVRLTYNALERVPRPLFRIGIKDIKTGTIVAYGMSRPDQLSGFLEGPGVVKCTFEKLPLRPRPYGLHLAIFQENFSFYDWYVDTLARFIVSPGPNDPDDAYILGHGDLVWIPYEMSHHCNRVEAP